MHSRLSQPFRGTEIGRALALAARQMLVVIDGSGPQASGQLHAWSGEQASGRFAHLPCCGANEFLFIDGGSWRTIGDKDELSKPYCATESLLHKGRMSLGRRPLSIQKLASRTTIASALRR